MKDHVDCNAEGLPHEWFSRPTWSPVHTYWGCHHCQVDTVTPIGARIPRAWLRPREREGGE